MNSLVVLALVVCVTLVIALPGQVVLFVTADVEGNEETGVGLLLPGLIKLGSGDGRTDNAVTERCDRGKRQRSSGERGTTTNGMAMDSVTKTTAAETNSSRSNNASRTESAVRSHRPDLGPESETNPPNQHHMSVQQCRPRGLGFSLFCPHMSQVSSPVRIRRCHRCLCRQG